MGTKGIKKISGKRKMIRFNEGRLEAGNFYVHNGVMLFLESINITREDTTLASGKRIRKDGRTRYIFENGTESNMLYRSLEKALYINGQVLTNNSDTVNIEFVENSMQ